MPFIVPIEEAQAQFPEFRFIKSLTPSEEKAAFHVQNAENKDLCLKIIAPTYSIDRLDREITALQLLSHPNIVKLVEYTFSTKNGKQRHYTIEEFIFGNDLEDDFIPGKPWDIACVSSFLAALCDGLDALRRIGLVHRDLKPSNIRVRPDKTPVIIDFGIARHLMLPDLTSTADGAAFGTPTYFAPEQFIGTKHDIDHRTDLFAVGILLYQALIGQHPFYIDGMTYANLQEAVCTSNDFLSLPAFNVLPPQWKLITSRLLEKERAKRPQAAGQVALFLRRLGGA